MGVSMKNKLDNIAYLTRQGEIVGLKNETYGQFIVTREFKKGIKFDSNITFIYRFLRAWLGSNYGSMIEKFTSEPIDFVTIEDEFDIDVEELEFKIRNYLQELLGKDELQELIPKLISLYKEVNKTLESNAIFISLGKMYGETNLGTASKDKICQELEIKKPLLDDKNIKSLGEMIAEIGW